MAACTSRTNFSACTICIRYVFCRARWIRVHIWRCCVCQTHHSSKEPLRVLQNHKASVVEEMLLEDSKILSETRHKLSKATQGATKTTCMGLTCPWQSGSLGCQEKGCDSTYPERCSARRGRPSRDKRPTLRLKMHRNSLLQCLQGSSIPRC